MSRKVQDDLTDREIPPAMLEKLLLRKLDMLERDYLMTVNAQRKPEVIEPIESWIERSSEPADSKSAEDSPFEPVPEPTPPMPLPQANIDKVKSLMSGLSLKAPSWATAVPDDVLVSSMLQQIHGKNSSAESLPASLSTSRSSSSSAVESEPSGTKKDKKKKKKKAKAAESDLSASSTKSVSAQSSSQSSSTAPSTSTSVSTSGMLTYFSRHGSRYLPWMCQACTFVNEAYPSVCETCESPNPDYAPIPFASSESTAAVSRTFDARSAAQQFEQISSHSDGQGNTKRQSWQQLEQLDRFEASVRRQAAKELALRDPSAAASVQQGYVALTEAHGLSSGVGLASFAAAIRSSTQIFTTPYALPGLEDDGVIPVAAPKSSTAPVASAPHALPAVLSSSSASSSSSLSSQSGLPRAAPKYSATRAPENVFTGPSSSSASSPSASQDNKPGSSSSAGAWDDF